MEEEILLMSKKGKGFRMSPADVRLINRGGSGNTAMSLSSDDELVSACRIMNGNSSVFVFTKQGRVLRCDTKSFPVLKRGATGVHSMMLKNNDEVVNVLVI